MDTSLQVAVSREVEIFIFVYQIEVAMYSSNKNKEPRAGVASIPDHRLQIIFKI
jgi:hypothetical protein